MPFNPIPLAKRLDRLCRAGVIDPLIERVGRVLLWNCRAPGNEEIQVSYERLAKLAGVGLTKTKEAIATLRDLGVLSWRKTRLRVVWGGGVASRQWRNVYRFLAPTTEVAERPTNPRQEKNQAKAAVKKVMAAWRDSDALRAARGLAEARLRRAAG